MKRHFVHIYHTFRSKFAVDAENQQEAIDKALGMFPDCAAVRQGVMGMVTPAMDLSFHEQVGEGYLVSEDAEEILGFLVDEVGDTEHSQSRNYDADGKPLQSGGKAVSIVGPERDTVLAALRLWQRLGGASSEEWDIATNGGSHEGLDDAAVDALCERLN
ncbi:MAG TPA: hypothetical protein H9899_07180 [Candidatus Sphingomonas excrementigallinarum]|nr:hypothetical protein [Candidatus Sphingomonas excrementigallinarum]